MRIEEASKLYDSTMATKLNDCFSMMYLLLNVTKVNGIASKAPKLIRTLCELLLVVNPDMKLKVIKILSKISENRDLADNTLAVAHGLLKLDDKSVFGAGLKNTFAKFLFDYALSIRSGQLTKDLNMDAVSK